MSSHDKIGLIDASRGRLTLHHEALELVHAVGRDASSDEERVERARNLRAVA